MFNILICYNFDLLHKNTWLISAASYLKKEISNSEDSVLYIHTLVTRVVLRLEFRLHRFYASPVLPDRMLSCRLPSIACVRPVFSKIIHYPNHNTNPYPGKRIIHYPNRNTNPFPGKRMTIQWARRPRKHLPSRATNNDKCYICNRYGHFARDCPDIAEAGPVSHRSPPRSSGRGRGRGRRSPYRGRGGHSPRRRSNSRSPRRRSRSPYSYRR